jgi:hypothetical protein
MTQAASRFENVAFSDMRKIWSWAQEVDLRDLRVNLGFIGQPQLFLNGFKLHVAPTTFLWHLKDHNMMLRKPKLLIIDSPKACSVDCIRRLLNETLADLNVGKIQTNSSRGNRQQTNTRSESESLEQVVH